MADFLVDETEMQEYTFSEIKKSFEHHFRHCESYRRFCEEGYHITPADLYSFADLEKIPQIPTAVFKSIDICSVEKETCKCCKSSGTKGAVSKIYRNKQTVRAFLESVLREAKRMYGLTAENCVIYDLGPAEEEAGDVWLVYAMGFLRNAVESFHFMQQGVLETGRLLEMMQKHNSAKRIVLLGPPAFYVRVFEYMEETGMQLQLPESTLLLTAGGWKSKSGDTMSRETLNALIVKYLGIGEAQIYDVYNQVESNTPFFECRCHNKHVPEGFHIIVRDPRTFEPLAEGREGVVTFLDPSSDSYPAFVTTDDIGFVTSACPCGRKGQVFHYVRRVKTVETKGCAMKLDQKMA